MLNLKLAEVTRGEVRLREEIAPDHPVWNGVEAEILEPLHVDLHARSVGDGVLVSGTLRSRLEIQCRRCLASVVLDLDEAVDLWFEEVTSLEAREWEGEAYPLPPRGGDLDLTEALREQLLLRIPEYVVCREECRGLCPRCGADLNVAECDCTEEPTPGPWDALKNLTFD